MLILANLFASKALKYLVSKLKEILNTKLLKLHPILSGKDLLSSKRLWQKGGFGGI